MRTPEPPLGRAALPARRLIGLITACHPLPTLVVTALSIAYAASLSDESDAAGTANVVVVGLVVLTGQLSIGWSNDWLDAARDRAVGRAGKPVVSGMVPAPLLRAVAVVALLVSLALSVMLGPAAVVLNALVVGGGWAYNAGLKATVWSWAPYAVAFGALPVLVATGMQAPVPAPGLVVAVALLAVAVHLANALPDLDDDEATGVRGLPQRIGVRGCTIAAPALLLVAALGGLLAAGATAVVVTVTLVGLGAAAGIAIVLGGRARTARAAYRVVLLMAVVVLLTVIVAAGG